ncbi:MAG: hypothetical protein K5666_01810 [Bacilli bacterium]|nr:hypothetical protein [Bacilli bacterium]
MKKSNVIISVLCVITAFALIGVTFLIIHSYHMKQANKVNEVYGVIKSVNADSIVIKESNTDKETTYMKDYENDYKEGDLVVVKVQGNSIKSHQIIVDNYSNMTTTTTTVVTNTTVSTTTAPNNNPVQTTTTSKANVPKTTTTSKPTSNVIKSSDDTVLEYVKNEYDQAQSNDTSETFKEKVKKGFITIVDFIFYDGEIKGVKFKELTAKGKAKVIYYALLIDSGIDSKFPGYKSKISDKYKDIKGKLVAEFLELKYDICTNSKDGCAQVKEDFDFLKKALSLTWDAIKSFFVYIKDLSVPKIKDWYESFRG